MMTHNRIKKSLWARALTAVVAFNLLVSGLGLPAVFAGATTRTGGIVTVGAITGVANDTLAIGQTSPLGVITWDKFGINGSETVTFTQPDANSLTVNRVTGSEGSDLLGTLTANGAVWILNPNGVLIGSSAKINAASFIAAAWDLTDLDLTGISLDGNDADLVTLLAKPLTLDGTVTLEPGADFSGAANVGLFGSTVTLDAGAHSVGSLTIGQGTSILLGTAAGGAITIDFSSVYTVLDGALNLDGITASGDLMIGAGGDITQTDAITVTGLTTLNTAGDITLANALNDFGTVSASGVNVTLKDTNNIRLGLVDAKTLTVEAQNGAITQTDVSADTITVSELTTLTAADTGDITLDNADNNFGTVSILSGNDVELADEDGLILGKSDVSGDLTVTADGAITQSGALKVGGTATFDAGSGNDIKLNNAANEFTTVAITSGNDVEVTNKDMLELGASTVFGDLTVKADGGITQSGALTVVKTATFDAGGSGPGYDITLADANDFGTVKIVNANNVALADVDDLTLDADDGITGIATFGGNLTVSVGETFSWGDLKETTGDVTLTYGIDATLAALTVGGDLSVTVVDGGITQIGTLKANALVVGATGAVRLLANDNDFVSLSGTAESLELIDVNDLALAGVNITGTLDLKAGSLTDSDVNTAAMLALDVTGDVTLDNANDFDRVSGRAADLKLTDIDDLDLAGVNITGTLDLKADSLTGYAANTAGRLVLNMTGDVTLDNAGNNFTSVKGFVGNNLTLVDSVDNLQLRGVNVGNNLTLTVAGNLTDANGATLGNTVGNRMILDVAGNVKLDNADNKFTSVEGSVRNNLTLVDSLDNLQLLGVDVGNNLKLTVAGNLTDANGATLGNTVGNRMILDVVGNATLDNADNDFTSVEGSAARLTLVDADTLQLRGVNIGGGAGRLDLTVLDGNLTDGNGAGVANTAGRLVLDVAGNATLDNADNNFTSVEGFVGNNLTLVDSLDNLQLRGVDVGNNLKLTVAGNLTDANDATPGNTVGNRMILDVAGNATLDNTDNDFTSVEGSAARLTLVDADTLQLRGVNIGGGAGRLDLTVLDGNLTDGNGAGAANTAGRLVLDVAGNATLDNTGNNFTSVEGSAANLTLVDADTLNLRGLNIDGGAGKLDLTVLAGNLTDGNGLDAANWAGRLILNVAGDATLDNKGSDFTSVEGSAANLTLVDADTLNLRGMTITDASAGKLDLTVLNGDLTDGNGAGAANTAAHLILDVAGDVKLDNSGNDFNSLKGVAENLTLVDADDLELDGVKVGNGSGTLNLTVLNGNLTDSAATKAGDLILNIGGDATLDYAQNNFGTVKGTANNLTLVDMNSLKLRGVDVGNGAGTLALTIGNNLTDGNGVNAANKAGALILNVVNNATLDNAGNDFNTAEGLAANLTLVDVDDLALSDIDTGNLTVTTGDDLTQLVGTRIIAGGTTDLISGHDIILANDGNDFVGSLSAVSDRDTSLKDINNLVLRDMDIGNLPDPDTEGNLTIVAGGNITQESGTLIVVDGYTFLSAGGKITLDNPGNDFNLAISATGDDIKLNDRNSFILDKIIAQNGYLHVTAQDGSITQTDVSEIMVDLDTVLVANEGGVMGHGDIILGGANNDFRGLVSAMGDNVVLADINDLLLDDVTAVGNFEANAMNGSITQTPGGRVIVAGTSDLTATGDIRLGNAINDFGGGVTARGGIVELIDANDITVAAIDARNTVWVEAINGGATIGRINTGNETVWVEAGNGDVTVGHIGTQGGDVYIGASGSILAAADHTASVSVDTTGHASVRRPAQLNVETAGGDVALVAGLDIGRDGSGSSGIRSSNPFSVDADVVTSKAGGDIALYGRGNLTLGTVNVQGLHDTYLSSGITAGGDANLVADRTINGSGTITADSLVVTVGDNIINTIRLNGGSAVDLWMNNMVGGERSVIGVFTTNGGLPGQRIRSGASWGSGALIFIDGMYAGGDPRYIAQIAAAEAFPAETPELKSKQGVFGDPVFVHDQMDINEPIALGLMELFITQKYSIIGDPALAVEVLEDIPASGLTPRNTYWVQ